MLLSTIDRSEELTKMNRIVDDENKVISTEERGDGTSSTAEQFINKDKALGTVLKILREISGKSRYELAAELDIGENYLREIEAGRKTATIKIIRGISEQLDISMHTIMFFCEDEELLKAFNPRSKVKPIYFRKKLLEMLARIAS